MFDWAGGCWEEAAVPAQNSERWRNSTQKGPRPVESNLQAPSCEVTSLYEYKYKIFEDDNCPSLRITMLSDDSTNPNSTFRSQDGTSENWTSPGPIATVALGLFMGFNKNGSLGSISSKRLLFCSVFSAGGCHRCSSLQLRCQRHTGALIDAGRHHRGLHQNVQWLVEGSDRRQGRFEIAGSTSLNGCFLFTLFLFPLSSECHLFVQAEQFLIKV